MLSIIAGVAGPSYLVGRATGANCDAVVPDVLHKVWVGDTCPALQDVVSLLTAALLLRPARIVYTTTARVNVTCEALRPLQHVRSAPLQREARCSTWRRCDVWKHTEHFKGVRAKQMFKKRLTLDLHAALLMLGVEIRELHLGDASEPIVAAMDGFRGARNGVGAVPPVTMSDYFRLYTLGVEGGMYLDGDMLVLRGSDYAAWRCHRNLIGVARGTWEMDCRIGATDGTAVCGVPLDAKPSLNSAALLAAPNSSLMRRWWQSLRKWSGVTNGASVCCDWPNAEARRHPEEIGQALTLGNVFPFRNGRHWKTNQSAGWEDAVEDAAARGVAVTHLSNFKLRLPQKVAVMRAVLARAVRLRGSEPLSEGERHCLDLVHRWMAWIYAAPPLLPNQTRSEKHAIVAYDWLHR